MNQALSIAVFGLMGIFLRWFIDMSVSRWIDSFPLGILAINILGSFFAGLVYVLGTQRGALSPVIATGLLVGFCGGFTTFSAYALQAFLLLEKADYLRGISYLTLSPIAAVIGVGLGKKVAVFFPSLF